MATVEQTGRCQSISSANHGDLFKLGNVSNEQDVGGWTITVIATSGDFSGGVYIVGRQSGTDAQSRSMPYLPVPFRQVCINNIAMSYSFDNALISASSIVQVPANGLALALLVSCTSGTADVYSTPLQGPTAP